MNARLAALVECFLATLALSSGLAASFEHHGVYG